MLSKKFREISKATDRVLTSDSHTHWVSTLAGRQILLGYKGWIWTYGINYGGTNDDIMKMFAGGSQTDELLKKYKISYVVVGPGELHDYHANENYFKSKYKIVLSDKDYRVYDVRENYDAN